MTDQTSAPLRYYLEGNPKSKTLLVFLQGWPDNKQMWDWINWKDQLIDHQLLFIEFPNTTNTEVDLKWGQDFPIIIQRIKITLDKFKSYEKRILVCHDWGCTYGYMFDQKYPGYFQQIVAMDVPGYVEIKNISQKLMVVAYQMWLIIAFLLGGWIGKKMTQAFANLSKHNPPYFKEITAARNYPYFYFWKNRITSALKKQNLYLYKYRPSAPVVYLYAKNKPFQFHGQKWMKFLDQTPGCETHGFDAGHWFMKKYGKFITELLNRRILAKL